MLVQTREQFDNLITVLLDAEKIAVDTETFWIGSVPGQTPLIGVAVHTEIVGRDGMEFSAYLPFRHQHDDTLFGKYHNLPLEWLKELNTPFEREGIKLLLHNAKFDLKVLEFDDVYLKGKIYDTMLIHYMVDEYPPHGLGPLSKKYLEMDEQKLDQKKMKEIAKNLGGWHKIPPDVMMPYACNDVLATYRLFPIFWKELQAQELDSMWDEEEQFIRCLARVEQLGIGINERVAKQLAYEAQSRLEEIQNELGFDPGKAKTLAHKLFELPPEGLGLPTPSRTRKDELPALDEPALSRFDHPVVDLVLEYRHEQKALSTWFQGFLDKIWPDGRVHTDYKRHGTVTTRLSSSNPNVQQLPKVNEHNRERVRSMLQAKEGFELWGFDYSQVEFRLGGCYSYKEDPSIIEAYEQGVDFHQLTGDRLGIPRDRDGSAINGKDMNFTIFYGGGPGKIAERMYGSRSKEDMQKAKQIYSDWWESYPGLRTVARFSEQAARERGFVRLWTGRRRHFKWPNEAYKAMNSIMQGGAAEIVKRSMLRLHNDWPELRMIAQVHDELWIEIPEGESDIYCPKIQQIMEWPKDIFPVEFPVDAKRLA